MISFQVVFLLLGSMFFSTSLMVFGHTSLTELAFLVKNFWLMLGGFILSVVIMLFVETPMIPNNTFDILMTLNHVTSIAACTLLTVAASKYITAVNLSVTCSIEVPLTLLAQITFLGKYGKEIAGPLQYAGALIVFVTVLTKPFVHMYGNRNVEDK